MPENISPDELAAAAAYENLHVPALFRQWAPRVVAAAEVRRDQRVLDVACGTGILAREARRVAGPGTCVAGLDPAAGMIAIARRIEPSIDWTVGIAEDLPWTDESFDAVISQFGLMFFRDRLAALREMLRVLAPGGRLAVAVWESLERSDAYPLVVDLLERVAGSRAADALRAPFVLGDPETLVALFDQAGGEDIEISTESGTARFPNIRTMVEADLRGWLPVMGGELGETQISDMLEEAESVLAGYVTDDGLVEFGAPAHIVTARKG